VPPTPAQPAPAAGEDPSQLIAGRVGRPHGLDGSFYVTRPRPRLLGLGTPIEIAGRTAAIVRRAGTDARPIIRLEGLEDREAAESLRGVELAVPSAMAPALGEGEWWAHELERCEVFDGDARVGVVARMIELPSCEALEVERGAGAALLVPMVKDAVRHVDVARGRIEVDLGFLDPAPPAPDPGAGAAAEAPDGR